MTLTHPFDIIMVPMQILIFLFTLYFFVIGFCGMWRRKEDHDAAQDVCARRSGA